MKVELKHADGRRWVVEVRGEVVITTLHRAGKPVASKRSFHDDEERDAYADERIAAMRAIGFEPMADQTPSSAASQLSARLEAVLLQRHGDAARAPEAALRAWLSPATRDALRQLRKDGEERWLAVFSDHPELRDALILDSLRTAKTWAADAAALLAFHAGSPCLVAALEVKAMLAGPAAAPTWPQLLHQLPSELRETHPELLEMADEATLTAASLDGPSWWQRMAHHPALSEDMRVIAACIA